MVTKKFFSTALCTTLLAASLFGCGSSTAEKMKDSSNEQVELTLWVTSRNADDWSASMEKKFLEEHPNIKLNKVVKEGDPGNEFYQGVAAGTAPDLVEASFTVTNSYIAKGILEPLNNYTDKWDEWQYFTKDYTDMFTKDGKIYAVPTRVSPMLFGYNKALFKEVGLNEAPKTWEEALAAAKKISALSEQTTGYATLAAEWTEWFFQYYVWQAGGDLTKQNEDGTATLTFTDPAVIKAAKYYQELKKEGVIQSDLTLKFTDLVTNFGLGKVGMMPFASDWVSEAITNGIDPDDIGLALPPVGPGGQPVTAIGGVNWLINAKSDQAKKDAAWEFIKFYSSKEYISSYFENLATKGAPNPIIVPRSDINVTDFYEFPEEYAAVLEKVKTIGRLEFYGKGDFGSYVDRAVQKILSDPSADPEKVFAEAQKLCEAEVLDKFNEANKK
ncbi:extracellular solute-binding protein [Streptococcus respiraculi]|uniref:extracellular solute-binding protein n=1 Tax=Streptococcus respiraculi TaxID=2021971 RepID=UPI00197E3B81|nr:extracellular solute-binding protein [Streptococcus respiraculi]